MNLKRQDRQNSISMASASEYEAGNLEGVLLGLHKKQATGVASIEALLEDRILRRIFVLRGGAIVYAGRSIPMPYEFVRELAGHMHIGTLDTVLEFAAKRASIQSVLQAMVDIRVLQWSEIAAAMRQQVVTVLKEVLPVSGRVDFETGTLAFDLRYSEGMEGFAIDGLLSGSEFRLQKKPTILSVDDSPIAQAMVKRTLSRDYEIVACSSAFDALEILDRKEELAALLLDLTLPEMDGLELCRMVRRIERYKGLPVILVTARDGMVDQLRGRFAGATYYLAKPVNPAELLAAIARFIKASPS